MKIGYQGELGSYLSDGWEIVSTNMSNADPIEDTFFITIRKSNEVRVLGYSNFYKIDGDGEEGFDSSAYKADFVKILSSGS